MIYSIGSTGEYVRTIQRVVGVDADGVYGATTANAVKDFQRNLGLQTDGVWGPATQEASDNFFSWLAGQGATANTPTVPEMAAAPTGPAPLRQPQNSSERDALAQMREWLGNFGLEALTDKAWQFMVDNGTEPAQLRMWLYGQPEFKARFPAWETLSQRQRAITPEQYIAKEREYKSILQNAGVLGSFFDSPEDFTSLIENEIDPEVFAQRINDGYQRVANSSASVRQAFTNYFGVAGDTALAAFFIDPERATPAILKAAKAAEIGGAALDYNVDINYDYATRLANMGVSYQQAVQGMQRVAQMRGLFETGVNETAVVPSNLRDVSVQVPQTLASTPSPEQAGISSTPQTPASTNVSGGGVTQPTTSQAGAEFVFGTNIEIRQGYERRLAQRIAEGQGRRTEIVTDRTGRTSLG